MNQNYLHKSNKYIKNALGLHNCFGQSKFKFLRRQFSYSQQKDGKWTYKPKRVFHFDNKDYLKLFQLDKYTYYKYKYTKPCLLLFLIALSLYKLYNFRQRRWYAKIFYTILGIGSIFALIHFKNTMLKSFGYQLYLSKCGKKIKVNTLLSSKLREIYIEDIENLTEDFDIDDETVLIYAYNQTYLFDCDIDKDHFIYDVESVKNIGSGRNIFVDQDLNNSTMIDIKFNQINNEAKLAIKQIFFI